MVNQAKKLRVTYSTSSIGVENDQKETVRRLGLTPAGLRLSNCRITRRCAACSTRCATWSRLKRSTRDWRLNDLQRRMKGCPLRGSNKTAPASGRGISAGGGKTAGRGTKGQNSRSGGGPRPYFEGGQLPLVRRLPHLRGFNNIWRVEYTPVNLDRLNLFPAGSEVSPEMLVAAGIIKSEREPVKVLGAGELDRPLTVKAHKFSASRAARRSWLPAARRRTAEAGAPRRSERSND